MGKEIREECLNRFITLFKEHYGTELDRETADRLFRQLCNLMLLTQRQNMPDEEYWEFSVPQKPKVDDSLLKFVEEVLLENRWSFAIGDFVRAMYRYNLTKLSEIDAWMITVIWKVVLRERPDIRMSEELARLMRLEFRNPED